MTEQWRNSLTPFFFRQTPPQIRCAGSRSISLVVFQGGRAVCNQFLAIEKRFPRFRHARCSGFNRGRRECIPLRTLSLAISRRAARLRFFFLRQCHKTLPHFSFYPPRRSLEGSGGDEKLLGLVPTRSCAWFAVLRRGVVTRFGAFQLLSHCRDFDDRVVVSTPRPFGWGLGIPARAFSATGHDTSFYWHARGSSAGPVSASTVLGRNFLRISSPPPFSRFGKS